MRLDPRNERCRPRWPLAVALALALLWSLSVPAFLGFGKAEVKVKGKPGDLHAYSSVKLEVTPKIEDQTMRWEIRCAKYRIVHSDLKPFVSPIPGGIAIELPASFSPKVTMGEKDLYIRWTPGEEGQAPPPQATEGSARTGGGFTWQEPKPPAYPLGPGDQIQVNVYGIEGMNETVNVDPDGSITFPVVGRVVVANLTVNQLQNKLTELLAKYVKEPQVNVQLLEYGSRYVNVLGQVKVPGRVPLKGAFRVLDAITQAGGFDEKSGDVEIQRRDPSGRLHDRVIAKEALLGGDESANIYLLDQDVLNVLPPKQVYVTGEVKTPGALPYSQGLTLLKAITLSGGFTQWAKEGKVDILRKVDGKPKALHVNVKHIERGKINDVPLFPDDQVIVRERKFF